MIFTTYVCPEPKTQVSVRMTYHNRDKDSCDDRVVKVLDLKSNGLCPRRFEPFQLRDVILLTFMLGNEHFGPGAKFFDMDQFPK